MIAKSLNTESLEMIAEGNISSTQMNTPIVHTILISLEDFLLRILAIKEILKKGKIIAAKIPKVTTMISFLLPLPLNYSPKTKNPQEKSALEFKLWQIFIDPEAARPKDLRTAKS